MAILKKKKSEEKAEPKEAKVVDAQVEVAQAALAAPTSNVIIRPLVSEKSTMQESAGKYTFLVELDANKVQIKQAIKAQYGVMPEAVNMINVEGKRLQRGRIKGKRSDYKKAIVTVKKGDKLDVHAGL